MLNLTGKHEFALQANGKLTQQTEEDKNPEKTSS